MSTIVDDTGMDDEGFDQIESWLLKEDGNYDGASKRNYGGDFGKKINLSNRVENDIVRSEKKGERRIHNSDKNDR